jgi:hypothetical protein
MQMSKGWRIPALIVALLASHVASAQTSGSGLLYVAEIVGTVRVIVNGEIMEVKAGDTLPAKGIIVETDPDSSITLVFSSGGSLLVGADTRLEFQDFTQDGLTGASQLHATVHWGHVLYNAPALTAGSSIVFDTPHASLTVGPENTVMGIDVTPAQTEVYLVQGSTHVAQTFSPHESITLEAGTLATITAPEAPLASQLLVGTLNFSDFPNLQTEIALTAQAQVTAPGAETLVLQSDLAPDRVVSPDRIQDGN